MMYPLRKLAIIALSAASIGWCGQSLAQDLAPSSKPWAHVRSDVPVDRAVRFGTLPNGMRFALRRNATPPGQVVLRLRIDAGSLMENDDQKGLAHFMEHMAFNGTKNIPENELIRTLERLGLAFGADTNASTSFDQTVYKLDVPRASDAALDTALNIMREQVSEATMAPAAIDEERGVILGEQRLRDSPGLRATKARFELIAPRVAARMPIGDMDVIRTAPRERFVEFYNRYYRPSRATLVAVGDFDVDTMEARIRRQFADWTPRGPDSRQADVDQVVRRGTATKIHVEPGIDPSVELIWTRPSDLSPDSRARRRQRLREGLGLAVLNQRLDELGRSDAAPLVRANARRQDVYRAVDATSLNAAYSPGGLDAAMAAVEREQRKLVQYGVSDAELRRQIVAYRTGLERGVAGAATSLSTTHASWLVDWVNDDEVAVSAQTRLALFEEAVKGLTAAQVTQALQPLFAGNGPLVLVTTPVPEPGGEAGVAAKLAAARRQLVSAPARQAELTWPYTDFGKPGAVASRRTVAHLGATVVTFANGTVLTVKPTTYTDNEILVSASTGIGELGMSADRVDPLYGARAYLTAGGLGKLTADEIDRVLIGRVYGNEATVAADRFQWSGTTRSEDLSLQMQVLAAFVTDPGLRPGPLEREKANYESVIDGLRSTASGAWQLDSPALITGGDKRAAIPSNAEMKALNLAVAGPRLRAAIGRGPIGVVMVGDLTVEQAIAATAATFGALPPRGSAPVPAPGADQRRFPAGGGDIVRLRHTGPADQALAFVGWPGPDLVDTRTEARRVELMTKVLQFRVNAEIRERQRLAYSPGASLAGSPVYRGSGYVFVVAQATPDTLPQFYAAVDKIVRDLKTGPVAQDELDRARRPLIEARRNVMSTNEYWSALLRDFAAKPKLVDEIQSTVATYEAVTTTDIQTLAGQYLKPETAWRATVTPASIAAASEVIGQAP